MSTYPLLELLVDRVQRVLDRDALQVPRRDFDARGEDEVDLFDRGRGQHLLEHSRVVDGGCRRVDFPR